ncbi:GNAT family N-acetyltransferase [Cryptosporangium aurantiacum]|uniref:Acetyltransferase (GNAT) domain-containing protein n=1 Tax=Cryptosporangium aurantiacum TaxID=134849 RepID=A0A1M7RLG8_9ACTN|nr:GNAT family N-acetyltransferase [Cryptosporangium aurantiacum]SHN47020.1 Acetyltransferase (GNAT) domain-containing protein [Cryptosporangium aurantiacum]
MTRIEELHGSPAEAEALTGPLLREYLFWIGERFAAEHGVTFEDEEAAVAAHHHEFAQELPHLLGPRGRLLVARTDTGVVAGVGALKPVDDWVAEIKRMYVRPEARGQGIGRAILEQLLADARTIGYRTARLETVTFMREAQALYRSLGFQDRPIFDGNEAGLSGLESFMLFMELPLDRAACV